MIRIFLTGYMGSGKTTLGRALAADLNVQFIDLDQIGRASCRERVSVNV